MLTHAERSVPHRRDTQTPQQLAHLGDGWYLMRLANGGGPALDDEELLPPDVMVP